MCKIKKMLAVVLALIMTFSMFAGIGLTANADDTENVKFSVVTDGSTPTVGKRFDVTIYIDNAKDLKETQIDVQYDRGAMQLTYVEKPRDATYQTGIDMNFGEVNYGFAWWKLEFSKAFTGDTAAVTLSFMPLKEGNTDLVINAYNWNGDTFASTPGVDYPERLTYALEIKEKKPEFVFDVSKDNLKKGDTFDLSVSMINMIDFYTMELEINYDKSLLKCIDIQPLGNHFEPPACYFFNEKGLATYEYPDMLRPIDDPRFYGDMDLFVMTFEVLEGGTCDISINVKSWRFSNQPENTTYTIRGPLPENYVGVSGDLTFRITNGEVTITDCVSTAKGEIAVPAKIEGYPVTAIGKEAFSGCSDITKISLPDTVKTIESAAFVNCSSLNSIVMPKNLVTIGESAFYEATALTSINIPASVTSIGEQAFYKCKALSKITVDANNKYYTNGSDGVVFSKDKTVLVQYPAGSKAESYTVPNGIKTIGAYAFCSAENLKSVSFPASLTTIKSGAFLFAYDLESVVIPSNVTSVEGSAFSCTGIKTAVIQDGLTSIPGQLFGNCAHIESVTIPLSVTVIDLSAFYGCDGINIYYNGTKEDWNKISLEEFFTKPLESATIHYSDYKVITLSKDTDALLVKNIKNVSDIENVIKNNNFTVKDKLGNELKNDSLIGTGSIIQVFDSASNVSAEYRIAMSYDVNGDGKITAADARLALRGAVNLDKLNGLCSVAADVDGVAGVTATDARKILRKSVGLE